MEEQFNFADYMYILRKNFVIIFILFFLIFGSVVVYTFATTPVYEAAANVQLQSNDQTQYLVSDAFATRTDIETQIEIIKSEAVAGSVFDITNKDIVLFVEPIQNSDIVQIRVQTTNPLQAQQLANEIAQAYVDFSLDQKQANIQDLRNLITLQIDGYKEELDTLTYELLLFSEDEERTVDQEIIVQGLQSDLSLKDRELRELNDRKQDALDRLESNPNTCAVTANDQTGCLSRVERGNLEALVGTTETRITELQKEILELNRQILLLDETKERTTEQELRFLSLQKEIEIKEQRYNYLLSRREEVAILASDQSINVQIVQFSRVPEAPVKPNVPLNIILGFIVGLGGSLGVIFAKEYLRDTYKSVEEIESAFGLNIVGVFPATKKRFAKSKSAMHYFQQHYRPDSEFSERVRMLRTNLLFYMNDRKAKVITITSPQMSDGKTTTTANLAMSFAKNDQRVLLIDGNLRRPILHDMFPSLKRSPGLTDVLLGDATIKEAIRKTKEPHLDIVFSGSANTAPSELLGSNRMREICQKLGNMSYDIVIFDNTALHRSESAILAANTDGVLLVVRHDKTRRDATVRGYKALERVKANVIGIVVNHLK